MDTVKRSGVLVPSFSSKKHNTTPEALKQCAQQAEGLGFGGLWCIDHFLKAPTYGQTWHDPFVLLTYLASQTKDITLGTCILVAALRNPVLLSKEIASLQAFSNERFVLGAAAGWNSLEFASVGVPKKERGARLDEILDVVRLLSTKQSASYQGKFYQFPEISIEPFPSKPTPIWIGGGSQANIVGSSEPNETAAEAVIQRIAKADGWFAGPQCTPKLLEQDWARVEVAAKNLGRDASKIRRCQLNYMHLVDTDNRDKAYEEQERYFNEYMGEARPWSFVKQVYLVGSITDVVSRLKERMSTGVITDFVFGPTTSDPKLFEKQLQILKTKVLPQL